MSLSSGTDWYQVPDPKIDCTAEIKLLISLPSICFVTSYIRLTRHREIKRREDWKYLETVNSIIDIAILQIPTTLICCNECLLCHLLIMLQVFISIDKVGLKLGVKLNCLDTYNTHLCHFVTWMMKYNTLPCHRCTVNWFIFILDRYLPHKFHSNQNVYRYGWGWGWPQWYQPSLQDTCVQFTLLPIFCTLWNGSGH